MMEQQNNIAVMTIEFGLTRQPESYENVRVNIKIPVFVTPGDNLSDLLAEQLYIVKATARAQVDDEFERGHGRPAPYSCEPRFTALVAKEARVLVIVPDEQMDDLPEAWRSNCHKEYRGHRLGFILERCGRDYRNYTLVDCTDEDWSKLPNLEQLVLWKYRPDSRVQESKFWVLGKREMEIPSKNEYFGWWNYEEYFRLNDGALRRELIAAAAKAGAALFDCTDGAFEILPQPVQPEPEEEEGWEDTDDGHGDDDQ